MNDPMDPRMTMARLPRWTQRPLTWITGCALPGQRLPRQKAWQFTAGVFGTMAAGLAIGAFAVACGYLGCVLLPLAWFLTVAGARSIQLGIVHHASHGNFTGIRKIDEVVGRIISILLLIEDYDKYKHGHLLDHHTESLSTDCDPTRQKLERNGLCYGVPVRILKRRLAAALLNPLHYLDEFSRRILSHYRGTGTAKRLAMTVWLAGLITASVVWPGMLLVWWCPLVVCYEICSLVRSVVRHWPGPEGNPKGLAAMAAKTSANFCGIALPPKGKTIWAETWVLTRWLAGMTVETICRFLFVNADGPNHDLHHLDARGDWPNHAALREDMQKKFARRGIHLTESWGFFATLQRHLEAMAATPATLSGKDTVPAVTLAAKNGAANNGGVGANNGLESLTSSIYG